MNSLSCKSQYKIWWIFCRFSPVWLCQQSYMYCRGGRPSFVRPPSLSFPSIHSGFSSKPNFFFYLSSIYPDHSPFHFFSFSFFSPKVSIFNFTIFFSFAVTWYPKELKFQHATSPTSSVRLQPNFMINMLVMGRGGGICHYFFGNLSLWNFC